MKVAFLTICTLIALSSCNSTNKNKTETVTESYSENIDVRKIEELQPADSNLAEKYNRSCFICHVNPDAKAPLVGDTENWNNLINEKGIATLLDHVKNGYNGMPAKGQCADCTDEDYTALINFMAGKN